MLILLTIIILLHHEPLTDYCWVIIVLLLKISVVKEMMSTGKFIAKLPAPGDRW
jgi:hypothetical protein